MIGHRGRFNKAFSLVELLIAMAVLVFGVAAVYDQFIATGQRGRDQLTRSRARYLAHQQLEELRAAPYQELSTWTPQALPQGVMDFPRYQVIRRIERGDDGTLALQVEVGWNADAQGGFAPGNSLTVRGVRRP